MTHINVDESSQLLHKSPSEGPRASVVKREHIHLTFKDVMYEVKLPKTKEIKKILSGVSGSVHGGQLMAIIGPSGAGKTTMLDILAQRQKGGTVTGDILMNGSPIDPGVFRQVSAYVQQDDLLHGFLTVEETITYAAQLRTESDVGPEEIKQRVSHVMKMLGIDHVKDRKIGNETTRGVSGGERKRTAIAVELVTNPSLLFLDEPTTGLDTFTALHLGYVLKGLANAGTTIIMSIHQPRSTLFRLFDVVLVLNGFGEEAYFGPSSEAVDFLTSVGVPQTHPDNPADFLLDSVSVVRAAEDLNKDDFPFLPPATQSQDIAAAFRSTRLQPIQDHIDTVIRLFANGSGLPPPSKSNYHRGFLTQVSVLSRRAMTNKFRDPAATIVAAITTIIFATLIGSIYWQIGNVQPAGYQDRLGVLFFLTMNTAFSNLGSLAVFLFDRSLYVREHKNGMYRPSAYFVGKIVQDIPFSTLFLLIFDATAYYMCGLQPSINKFGWFLLANGLVMLNSYTLCMMISSVSSNYQVANTLAPLVLVLFLLPSGFLINLDSIPIIWRWIKYISFFRFGFQSVVLNEFEGLHLECPPVALPKSDNINTTALKQDLHAWVNEYEGSNASSGSWSLSIPSDIGQYLKPHLPCITDGTLLVEDQLGFKGNEFNFCIMMMSITMAVYFIFAYLGLRFLRGSEGK